MDTVSNFIKQRLSLREPLGQALDVVSKLTEVLALRKPEEESDYESFLAKQLVAAQTVCQNCRDFERDFPSFAFSIATGIGKTAWDIAAATIAMGGHVRVGFEDNVYMSKGVLAKSNGEMVERVVQMAKLMNREVATPAEARQILGLKPLEA